MKTRPVLQWNPAMTNKATNAQSSRAPVDFAIFDTYSAKFGKAVFRAVKSACAKLEARKRLIIIFRLASVTCAYACFCAGDHKARPRRTASRSITKAQQGGLDSHCYVWKPQSLLLYCRACMHALFFLPLSYVYPSTLSYVYPSTSLYSPARNKHERVWSVVLDPECRASSFGLRIPAGHAHSALCADVRKACVTNVKHSNSSLMASSLCTILTQHHMNLARRLCMRVCLHAYLKEFCVWSSMLHLGLLPSWTFCFRLAQPVLYNVDAHTSLWLYATSHAHHLYM